MTFTDAALVTALSMWTLALFMHLSAQSDGGNMEPLARALEKRLREQQQENLRQATPDDNPLDDPHIDRQIRHHLPPGDWIVQSTTPDAQHSHAYRTGTTHHLLDEEGDCDCVPRIVPLDHEGGAILYLYIHDEKE